MAQYAAARIVRPWLLGAAVLVACGCLGFLFLRLSISGLSLPLNDFVQYWAAGRLNLQGENPYDLDRLEELERAAGREASVLPMYNPPWTLAVVMPFGILPARLAYLLWMACELAALGYAAVVLWHYYGGPTDQLGMALVLTITFVPTFLALLLAQISPLLLLGAVLFLQAERRGMPALAGTALVLLAIKPHICYLFWIALVLWSWERQRWSVPIGGILAGSAATLVAVLFHPGVLTQFAEAFWHRPPAEYHPPTLGTVLRLAFGEEHFWWQYLPMIPGLLWFAWYWNRHDREWDWGRELPLLLFVSLITAAYGAWPFDLVILLVPLVQVACVVARTSEWHDTVVPLVLYCACNAIAAVMVFSLVNFLWFIWLAPALLIAYLAACRMVRSDAFVFTA